MRPLSTVITINAALLLISWLACIYLLKNPYTMAFFTSGIAGLNFIGLGLGLMDRKREFIVAFCAGLTIAIAAATISWIIFFQNAELIRDGLEV